MILIKPRMTRKKKSVQTKRRHPAELNTRNLIRLFQSRKAEETLVHSADHSFRNYDCRGCRRSCVGAQRLSRMCRITRCFREGSCGDSDNRYGKSEGIFGFRRDCFDDVSGLVEEVIPSVVSITSRTLIDSGGYGDYFNFFFGGGYSSGILKPSAGSGKQDRIGNHYFQTQQNF